MLVRNSSDLREKIAVRILKVGEFAESVAEPFAEPFAESTAESIAELAEGEVS